MNKKTVKTYFEENAERWVLDGYSDDGYNYPVGFHRTRIVSNFISKLNKKGLKIADLGCGGGNLAITLARNGHFVTGVDQSVAMMELIDSKLHGLSPKIRAKVKFVRKPLEKTDLEEKTFDVVTSMGVIGYLANDSLIFATAKKLLKPGGYFMVSCRNKLFNMTSISFRTKKEIATGKAVGLINEIEDLETKILPAETMEFIKNIKKFPIKINLSQQLNLSPSEKHKTGPYTSKIEPRQQTPKQLNSVAKKLGFKTINYYGVHPHLLNPRLNKLLPPQVFNKISAPLEAFEHLPISLSWSSVFIGIFQKNE